MIEHHGDLMQCAATALNRVPLLQLSQRSMRSRFIVAVVVALTLLGQPIAVALCAVQCHNREIPQELSERHCGSDAARDPASATFATSVAFCDHTVAVASTTTERHQVSRPAEAHAPWSIATPAPLADVLVSGVSDGHGPPGSVLVPLSLRI